MPAILKDILVGIVLLAVVGGAVEASLYAKKTLDENSANSALLQSRQEAIGARAKTAAELSAELAQAKADLAAESAKLATMQAAFNPEAYDAAMKDIENKLDASVSATDPLFNDPNSAKADLTVSAKSPSVTDEINALRQNINNMITEGHPDIQTIQQYINDLSSLVNTLTPANSGLTQEQISSYQSAVSSAESSLGSALAAQAASPAVSPADIQSQQQAVAAAQAVVDSLAQELSSATSSSGGTSQTPGSTGSSGTGQSTPASGSTGSGTTASAPASSSTGSSSGSGSGSSSGQSASGSQFSNSTSTDNTPPPSSPNPVSPEPGKPQLIQGTNTN